MITALLTRGRDNRFEFTMSGENSFESLTAGELIASAPNSDTLQVILALREGQSVFAMLGILAIDELQVEQVHEHLRPCRRPPHPGKIADRERRERSWTIDDLAARLHEPTDWVLSLIRGDLREMYDADFYHLADAFGTTIALWRNLYEGWRDYIEGV